MSVRKLTDDDVRLIRRCFREKERLLSEANKLNDHALAQKFDVSDTTINDICMYKRYKNVED